MYGNWSFYDMSLPALFFVKFRNITTLQTAHDVVSVSQFINAFSVLRSVGIQHNLQSSVDNIYCFRRIS